MLGFLRARRIGLAIVFGVLAGSFSVASAAGIPPGNWAATGQPLAPVGGAVLLPTGKALAVDANLHGELFDPKSGTWALTGGPSSPGDGPATVMGNGHVLLIAQGTRRAQEYNPTTGTWVTRGAMLSLHDFGTFTPLPNGQVLVTGGSDGTAPCCPVCCAVSTAELYDPVSGTFSRTADMPEARVFHFAVLLPSGKVLVGGGFDQPDNIADLYDATFGTWTRTGAMVAPASQPGVAVLGDGRVLVAGSLLVPPSGHIFTPSQLTQVYTPATGTWQRVGDLAGPQGLFPDGVRSFVLADGSAVFLGPGVNNNIPEIPLVNAERFDPTTGTWTPGVTGFTENLFAETLLPNGSILGTDAASAGVFTPTALPPRPTSCNVSLAGTNPQGHSFIRVAARDVAAGLQSVSVVSETNATVTLPQFPRFSRDPQVTTATRTDQAQRASLTLKVTTAAGASITCDPIVSQLVRQHHRPAFDVFHDIPSGESQVLIVNGQPGFDAVEVRVNGRKFELDALTSGAQSTLNVANAMRPGTNNVIAVRGAGAPGASAEIVIGD